QPEQIEDYIDVFIYPVRSPDWRSNHRALLSAEADNARKDIDSILAELEYTDIAFTATASSQQHVHQQALDLYFFAHEYTDLIINTYTSNTFLTIVGDKFIKIRHTALKDAASREQAEVF